MGLRVRDVYGSDTKGAIAVGSALIVWMSAAVAVFGRCAAVSGLAADAAPDARGTGLEPVAPPDVPPIVPPDVPPATDDGVAIVPVTTAEGCADTVTDFADGPIAVADVRLRSPSAR